MKTLLQKFLYSFIIALFCVSGVSFAQSNAALKLGEKSVFKDEAFRVHR